MNAGIAAYVILTQNTDVTDIVGVNIFPEVAEQETATPFVVYQLLSVAPEDTHDGPSKLDEVRFEFLCYADSYALAADLGSKVRGALDRVSGTYNGVNVESVQFNDVDIDTIDAPRRFAQVLTFTFRIKRDNVEIAQGTPVTGAKLGDLYDVDTTGVTDGQVIAYDAAAQEWQPADDAGGVTELGQLTDVQFGQGGPESGELLKYDGSEWTNDTIVKSEIGLGNVDNTSDANKPVSTATQTELNAKANSADFSNVDNTSDADKPVSTATQTALNAKADTSAVPTDLNDLSDVTIVGTPVGNQALIYDATAGAFKSQVSYTNRFEDEVENGKQMPTIFAERAYSVKAEGDGVFIDPESDTPAAGKVIVRKIYHKTGFITDADVIGDYTLIHTFADDTAYADTVATFEGFEDGATYGVPPFTLLQTWEEISSVQYLLDKSYGSGAAAAYSTRQLRFAQTDCMVIRRASDSTTTTIGFDSEGNIDEAAITTFCTGNTCTVSSWIDQSGNGNDATATTARQPTIYTGGALVKEGGRLALLLDGTDDGFDLSAIGAASSKFGFITHSVDSSDTAWSLLAETVSTDVIPLAQSGSGSAGVFGYTMNNIYKDGSSVSPNTRGDIYNAYTSAGQSLTALDFSGDAVGVLFNRSSFVMQGKAQEVVLYASDKSTDRTSIEENIGDYFTQNTPLLDTYSGAAAAYSLRLLDSTYTGSAIRVRRSSDNTEQDIGFNVFSELDTVSLLAFAGAGDAFVKTWYSQTGSNDATQTTTSAQPKIVSSGAVITENGKPSVYADGTKQMSLSSDISVTDSDYFVVDVTQRDRSAETAAGGQHQGWQSFGGGDLLMFDTNAGAIYSAGYKNPSFSSSDLTIKTFDLASPNLAVYENGSSHLTSTYAQVTMQGNIKLFFSAMIGHRSELIIYASDQSSNRANIESNIATFYDITL